MGSRLDRTKNTKRNLLFGVFQRGASIILPFLQRTIIIETIGVQYLGINTLFASVLSVLSLAELGFGSAMVYAMYRPIAEGDDEQICALLSFYRKCYRIIGSVILVIGLLLTPFVKHLIKDDVPSELNIYIIYLISLSSVVVSYFLYAYKNSLLSAFQRNDVASKVTMLLQILQYAVQIAVILVTKNFYIFMIVAPIMSALTNLLTAQQVKRLFPKYSAKGVIQGEKKEEILAKVKSLFTYKIGNVVSTSVDNIVISAFMGLTSVAMYGNYYYVINALFGFLTVYYNAMQAGLGNGIVNDSIDENYALFKRLVVLQTWVIGWMSICLMCLYQPFISLWVRRELMFPIGVVVCFVIYFYSWKINDISHIFKEAAGLWNYDRWRPLIASVFNLGLNILLVQYIGIYGIIISTIATELCFTLLWGCQVIYKHYFLKPVKEYYFLILIYTIATCVIGALTYWVAKFINIPGIIGLGIRGVICLILPNLFYLAIYMITGQKDTIYFLLNKITRRR